MTFKFFLPAVLGLLALCGVMWLPASMKTAETLPLLALALLVHIPAMLPVALHGKLLSTKSRVLNAYPEALLPPCLALCWGLTGLRFGADATFVALGVATLMALSLCYGAVRFCDQRGRQARGESCQSVTLPPPSIMELSKRYIYFMRFALVLCSLGVLLAQMSGAVVPLAYVLLPGVIAVAVTLLVAVSLHSERETLAEFKTLLPELLARELQAAPTSVAVYHAGTSKADLEATAALCGDLSAAGTSFVLIVREQAALEELRELGALHLWHAEKLSALTQAAQPALRVVFYAQDHPKNSHFTRFAQYEHVFATAHCPTAHAAELPQTVALYSKVITPNAAKAAQWKHAASEDVAARILTQFAELGVPFAEPEALAA